MPTGCGIGWYRYSNLAHSRQVYETLSDPCKVLSVTVLTKQIMSGQNKYSCSEVQAVGASDAWLQWYLPMDCLEDGLLRNFRTCLSVLRRHIGLHGALTATSVIHKCLLLACYPSFAATTQAARPVVLMAPENGAR